MIQKILLFLKIKHETEHKFLITATKKGTQCTARFKNTQTPKIQIIMLSLSNVQGITNTRILTELTIVKILAH